MNKLSVDISPWHQGKLYAPHLNPQCQLLGVVWRNYRTPGALVKTGVGKYVQVNAGAVRSLPQREIIKLIKEAQRRLDSIKPLEFTTIANRRLIYDYD